MKTCSSKIRLSCCSGVWHSLRCTLWPYWSLTCPIRTQGKRWHRCAALSPLHLLLSVPCAHLFLGSCCRPWACTCLHFLTFVRALAIRSLKQTLLQKQHYLIHSNTSLLLKLDLQSYGKFFQFSLLAGAKSRARSWRRMHKNPTWAPVCVWAAPLLI